jgi:ABC-type dipeptide/oligopeptide/nickel transport system permease component
LWNTFLLSFFALIIAWGIAIPLGIWAAVRKDSWVDRLLALRVRGIVRSRCFALAAGAVVRGGDRLVSRRRRESPLHDLMSPAQQFWDHAHHLILPAIVLAASDLAGIMRQMRSSNLLDTLRAEYVTAARARGLGEGWVIYKHALRNAINPAADDFRLLARRAC